MAALPPASDAQLRDVRFDAGTGALTILVDSGDLEALQSVETALRRAGLPATGGAATQQETGAEMQIVIADGA